MQAATAAWPSEAPKFCITTPQLVTLHSSHCGEAGEEEGGRRGLANYARFGRVSPRGAEVGERGPTRKGEGDVAAATAPKGSLIYLHEAALPCCHSVTQLRFGRSPHCRDAFARFRGPRSPPRLRSLPSPSPSLLPLTVSSRSELIMATAARLQRAAAVMRTSRRWMSDAAAIAMRRKQILRGTSTCIRCAQIVELLPVSRHSLCFGRLQCTMSLITEGRGSIQRALACTLSRSRHCRHWQPFHYGGDEIKAGKRKDSRFSLFCGEKECSH